MRKVLRKPLRVAVQLVMILALLLPSAAVAAPVAQITVENPTDAIFAEGIQLYDSGQWQAALEKFVAVQQTYQYYNNIKRNGQAWEYIGHARLKLGDLPGAVVAYQTALPLAAAKIDGERQAKLHLYLARTFTELQDYAPALAAQQAALALAQALANQELIGKSSTGCRAHQRGATTVPSRAGRLSSRVDRGAHTGQSRNHDRCTGWH